MTARLTGAFFAIGGLAQRFLGSLKLSVTQGKRWECEKVTQWQ
jgi:hypothetical protein